MTVPNPLGTFPVPSYNGVYRMGPLFTDSPDLDFLWNTEWPDGTATACGEPEGWEGVDYITPIDQVGGQDGGLLGPQSRAPRVLECQALIVATSAANLSRAIARLRYLFGPQSNGQRQPVVWEQYDFGAGQRLALITRPVGQLRPVKIPGVTEGGLAAGLTFSLVAANPVTKYRSGAAETAQVGLADPALVGGRTYSKTYPYTYGSSSATGGEMLVTNSGDAAADVVFTVTGPVDYPIIFNATTGQAFQVNRVLLAGETVTIDSRSGVVTPASVRLIGAPFVLAAGPNTIRWQAASGTYYPAALLRLDWRSTYL